jgi:hypothetical protein
MSTVTIHRKTHTRGRTTAHGRHGRNDRPRDEPRDRVDERVRDEKADSNIPKTTPGALRGPRAAPSRSLPYRVMLVVPLVKRAVMDALMNLSIADANRIDPEMLRDHRVRRQRRERIDGQAPEAL